MSYDVLIVGAGPAGLACGIRLKQRALQTKKDLSVCIVDKGSEVGAHLLSGAIFEPRALAELFPDWKAREAPLTVPVTSDSFCFLTKTSSHTLPLPPPMQNHGNYIISLGRLAKWLATQAEALGVEIYPGFAAAEMLYDQRGFVIGVATGDAGVSKSGEPSERFARGVELHAKQTVIAEGCRGSLTKTLFGKYHLRDGVDPQTYALGIKEVWEVEPSKHRPGHVQHSVGFPMDAQTYGGSWIYHWENNLVSIGFVVGLDYKNPYLSPFEEFQRFKQHPSIRPLLEGGKRLSYGARALSEGGFQSVPRLTFPGGVLIGDAAGFLNVPKIKGNHLAMKSGMVAAEALFDHLVDASKASIPEVHDYRARMEKSWVWQELHAVRNIRPSFRLGLYAGLAYSALDTVLLRGKAPWTFANHADNASLSPARDAKKLVYPKPDGVISFDRLSSVFLSNTNHEEDQPPHLKLRNPSVAIDINLATYDSPETKYCPAGVYEIVEHAGQPSLQINAQNCVHCKTCDIKDPTQNIDWCVPEGGGGPNYQDM